MTVMAVCTTWVLAPQRRARSAESAEGVLPRQLFIGVKGLRVKLATEGDDLVPADRVLPELFDCADGEIVKEATAHGSLFSLVGGMWPGGRLAA